MFNRSSQADRHSAILRLDTQMDHPSLHKQASYGNLRPSPNANMRLHEAVDWRHRSAYGYPVPPVPAEPPRATFFDSNWNLYAGDWATTDFGNYVAVGTLNEGPHNRIHILAGQNDRNGQLHRFVNIADGSSILPQTRLQWDPAGITPTGQLRLLSSSDCLRMWSFDLAAGNVEALFPLVKKSKRSKELAPLTSFDWCEADPNIAITSSIDTMCTLWDLPTQTMRTYLIAHDSEVYDCAFVANSSNKFVSCGADGSVRLFDLRSLARSTILFTNSDPLLRVAPNPNDPNIFATFGKDSPEVYIVDIRSPRNPVSILQGHSEAVNCVKWAPNENNYSLLASGGDDSQVLLWDLSQESPLAAAFTDRSEVNNLFWNIKNDWIGSISGKTLQGIKLGP